MKPRKVHEHFELKAELPDYIIPIEDDMIADAMTGTTFAGEIARRISSLIDEKARQEPTAILCVDGRARVGMYGVSHGEDVNRGIDEIILKIRNELKRAGLEEYQNSIVPREVFLNGVGETYGAYVDVPCEKWIEYVQREEYDNV